MNSKSKTVQCSNCGQPAAGNFCSFCGASLVAGATPKKWNAQMIAPWVALGVAALALGVSLAVLFGKSSSTNGAAPMTATAPSPAGQVDLSAMTPRQAADRLYNRIMAASESGRTDEALRFAPMALQAYESLGTLDNDALYHVALIYMVTGNEKSARGQLDKLFKSVPNHLLGLMVENHLATQSGDSAGAARTAKAFLAAYDAEIAAGRTEYQDHRDSIERFREAVKKGK